jgi:predicted kinase
MTSPVANAPAGGTYWLALAERPAIDWHDLAARLPFVAAMQGCLQDTIHHAEGDVWTHTRLVVEALKTRRGATASPPARWPGLFLAALLHDIAKPATRSEHTDENGLIRVHHHGHSRLGASMAWEFLWREGVPRPIREQVYHLIFWHQRPFHLGLSSKLENRAITFSQLGRWDELLAHAASDLEGRISATSDDTATHLALLGEAIEARNLMTASWPFASDAARVWHARVAGRSPYYDPPSPKGSHVIVLSGLPGAGKDTYCRTHLADWPQVSLDRWREVLGIAPDEAQGRVVQKALEEARGFLRAKRPFVWNATNVSRQHRDRAVGLCLDYDALVEIHAFDTPPEQLLAQNRAREKVVPEAVIEKLIRKWEPPSLLEAHKVVWVEPAPPR